MNKKTLSIRWRLLLSLGLSLPLLCFVISVLTAIPLYREMSADDDKYLRQLARALVDDRWQVASDISDAPVFYQPTDDEVIEALAELGSMEDDDFAEAFAFAVWDKSGQLLEQDGGKVLRYQPHTQGFIDTESRWHEQAWRVFYYTSSRTGETVAVAQAWRDRLVGMQAVVLDQLLILLLILPFLLAVVAWSVHRGLRPLNALAKTVNQRHAHDLAPVNTAVPKELQPLTTALNQLFARVSDTIAREQRFTADAAHELRSPLAAIKVQTNELAHSLSAIAENADSQVALQRIQGVTDRASHLIDQLLTLSQLDNADSNSVSEPINWLSVSESALQSVNRFAREKHLVLKRKVLVENATEVLPLSGQPALLTLMLRNLLDNAIRYSPNHECAKNAEVVLTLASDYLSVRDHGNGIPPEQLPRVRERFFRPPGQVETGSGLGLSIVERICEQHSLTFELANHPNGGLQATVQFLQSDALIPPLKQHGA